MVAYIDNNTKEHRDEFTVPLAWYGKVMARPLIGGKEEEELCSSLCPMGNLASYIKEVVAVPPQHIYVDKNDGFCLEHTKGGHQRDSRKN